MSEKEKELIEDIQQSVDIVFDYELYSEDAKILLNLIQKQEKIIDKMAEWIYEKFKERPMTVSKAFNHNVCLWKECADINREVNCDYCIKQYFERQVEENGK